MEKWTGKVAVVTGASSGIGEAIARAMVHHGLTVVGLARRVDKVQQIADELSGAGEPGRLYARRVDLRKESEILEAFAWLDTELGGADILVNNAGILHDNYITEGVTEEWRAIFDVNVLAVSICIREYLKSMEQRNNQNGHIFIINSIAGHLAEYPRLNMYAGSKHAMRAISMCLRRELAEKKSTIKVTSVSPGPVATEIFVGTSFEEMAMASKVPILASEDVAKVVIDALTASPVSEICEVVMTPVPTQLGLY